MSGAVGCLRGRLLARGVAVGGVAAVLLAGCGSQTSTTTVTGELPPAPRTIVPGSPSSASSTSLIGPSDHPPAQGTGVALAARRAAERFVAAWVNYQAGYDSRQVISEIRAGSTSDVSSLLIGKPANLTHARHTPVPVRTSSSYLGQSGSDQIVLVTYTPPGAQLVVHLQAAGRGFLVNQFRPR